MGHKKANPSGWLVLYRPYTVEGRHPTGHGTALSSVEIFIPTFDTRYNCYLLDGKKIT